MELKDLIDNFNPAQKEAISHLEGPQLIIAGAGSGKTLVAVKRAEYLTKNYSDMFQRANVAIFAYNKV